MSVTVALLVAFGTIFLFLKKVDENEEEPEIIEQIDLNKIDFKSSRYNMGSTINNEKRLPALNKNSSMKFLNINSNYLSNINFQNLNNIPISKK